MNKKQIIGLVAVAIAIAVGLPTALIVQSSMAPNQQPTGSLDFNVSAKSD